jgi:hypothetical protein
MENRPHRGMHMGDPDWPIDASSDFEVQPIGTGRQLADHADRLRDLATAVRYVLNSSNLTATQRIALRAALANAGQPDK